MKMLIRDNRVFWILILTVVFLMGYALVKVSRDNVVHIEDNTEKGYQEGYVDVEYLTHASLEAPLEYIEPDLLREEEFFTQMLYTLKPDEPMRTNQWLSSIYVSDTSQALFAYPLVAKFEKNALQVGYPNINATPHAVFGSFIPDIVIEFSEPITTYYHSSSDLSAKIVLRSDVTSRNIAIVTITRGSPYVFVEMVDEDEVVRVKTSHSAQKRDGNIYTWNAPKNAQYMLAYDAFARAQEDVSLDNEIALKSLEKEAVLSVAVVPEDGSLERYQEHALDVIVDTEVGFSIQEDRYVNTRIYTTRSGDKTIAGFLPGQYADFKETEYGTLSTIRGEQKFFQGKIFQFRSTYREIAEQFIVRDLSDEQKGVLRELIRKDTEPGVNFTANDTYFYGKQLYRWAAIYDMAVQLGMTEESQVLHDSLVAQFDQWRVQTLDVENSYGEKYLVYDPIVKGAVGQKPSFGSEGFNDHHFHYGYFVHTAAILGRHDADFTREYQKLVNVFVKDYLNYDRSDDNFAFIRNYDLYEGHSWASGVAEFADGNNQESTSEAVHAYYAAYVWAKTIQNDELEAVSQWLYNREADATQRFWFVYGDEDPVYDGYDHSLVSLLWNGKVEYATWFSPDPEAKLGIQILPLHAGSNYLNFGDEEIRAYLAETSFPGKGLFYDYHVMFLAMSDPQQAQKLYEGMSGEDIDDGNSRSFVYAWISRFLADKNN